MEFMKGGASAILEDPENQFFVQAINQYSTIPLIGILIGTAIAGTTQSSSATTSLVIALGGAGLVGLDMSIAIVMGANIGTCFLELFAGFGATTPAKRTAVAQSLINIIGVAVFFPFLGPFTELVTTTAASLPRQIANAHTIFNVIVSLMFIPLVGPLVKLCERLIPEKEGEVIGQHFFDDEMLNMPQAALQEAEREILGIADATAEMIFLGKSALLERNHDDAKQVLLMEDDVDERCRSTESFLDKIPEMELSEEDAVWRMKLLAMLTDIERVGDLCENIGEFALERMSNGIAFSDQVTEDIGGMFDLVAKTYRRSIKALKTKNTDVARNTIEMEDEVDILEKNLRRAHNERISQGICRPEADTVYVETLRNLERIGDHADNIALDILLTQTENILK
jgi:phosphate:Na+ symporter